MVMNKLWKTGKGTAILILSASFDNVWLNLSEFNPARVKQLQNSGTYANSPW